jgi:hypothetical protein
MMELLGDPTGSVAFPVSVKYRYNHWQQLSVAHLPAAWGSSFPTLESWARKPQKLAYLPL